MQKCKVVKDKAMPAFVETVLNEEKGYTFYRVSIDTPFGVVYLYPKYNSRESVILEFVNKDS